MTSPFAVLGLTPAAALGDEDVRGAWRRIAEATHPDRADGGDPVRFAAAAAAYAQLRTASGRGEALADLQARATPAGSGSRHPRLRAGLRAAVASRPLRLGLRLAVATAAGFLAVLAVGWQPASIAIITGALTWLVRTAAA